MFGRAKFGVLSFLALSAALAFGCSGSSESGDNDEDGDAGEGSGGTSSFGGTTARGGGAGVLGGGGSGQATCQSICERTQACPDQEPLDCMYQCEVIEEGLGPECAGVLQDYWNCAAALPDICAVDTTACASQAQALVDCANGTPGCGVGSLPANPSCSALCPRLDACPNASATCASDCAESDVQAAAVGCSLEYQEFVGCASTCADVCSLGDYDCLYEYDNFYYCVIAYCAANPSAAPCL
jgi:hypothetical protein